MESKRKHDITPKQNCSNEEFITGSNIQIFWNVYNACFTTKSALTLLHPILVVFII